MTAMPPPPAVPMPNYGQSPVARPTNVFAIVSLVCGIIGCLVITGIAGIITGIIGLSQSKQKGGRGLAVTGIILSVLSLLAVTLLAGGTFFGIRYAIREAKKPVIAAINACVDGDIAKATQVAGLSADQAQALSNEVKTYGHCTDLSFGSFNRSVSTAGDVISANGTATFEKAGTKNVAIVAEKRGDKLVLTDIQLN